jgi:hypothetical protein
MAKKKEEVIEEFGNVGMWKTICMVSCAESGMYDKTDAMQVVGGVIVRSIASLGKETLAESSVFVPNAKLVEKEGKYTIA